MAGAFQPNAFQTNAFQVGQFSLDAAIRLDKQFRLDATLVGAIYLNAVSKRTQTASFGVSAVIKRTLTGGPYNSFRSNVSGAAAYWPLADATTGTPTEVVAGYSTITSAPANITPQKIQAANPALGYGFNWAAQSYLQTTAFTQPSTSDATIEAWFQTTGTGEIWNGRVYTTTAGRGISLTLSASVGQGTSAGCLNFFINSDGLFAGRRTNSTYNDGLLHHVVAVWDGTSGVAIAAGQFTIYVDGVAVAMTNLTSAGSASAPLAGNAAGVRFLGFNYGTWTGWAAHIVLYTRPLSAGEALAHYNAGSRTGFSIDAYKTGFHVDAEIRNLKFGSFALSAVIKTTNNFGATDTEFLRPISDIAGATGITYSTGTTGWNLVDEATLDTADLYRLSSNNGFIYHQFAPSTLRRGFTFSEITVNEVDTNLPSAGTASIRVLNPATGLNYNILSRPQDSVFAQPTLHTTTLTTKPWDSAAWTAGDLASIQAGAQGSTTFANLRIYQYYIGIAYTYPGGITLDAKKRKVQTGSFGVRASKAGVIRLNAEIVPRRFTINAAVGLYFPVSAEIVPLRFRANAVIQQRMAASFGVSAVIKKTITPVVGSLAITWDAWFSHSQIFVFKHEQVHLRRDSTSGAILATGDPQGGGGDGGDTSSGHQFHSTGSFTDNAPTTGHYVLSIVSISGSADLYSDSRNFAVGATSISQSNNVYLGAGSTEQLFTGCDLTVNVSPLVLRAFVQPYFRINAEIRRITTGSFTVAAVIKDTATFGASGTVNVRPISDITSSGINYSSGTTGWDLVDEVVLDTADWYHLGVQFGFMYHQFGPPNLGGLRGISASSVTLNTYDFNPPVGGSVDYSLRDPATGTNYAILGRGQDSSGGPHTTASSAQTSRPWGGSWTAGDIGGLQAGGTSVGFSGPNLTVYQFYLAIAYSYAGGIVLRAVRRKTQTGSFTVRAFITGFNVDAVIVPLHFTIDAAIGTWFHIDAVIVQPHFEVDAVRQRIGTPVVGNLVFPGSSIIIGGPTANAHSPTITVLAGGHIDIYLAAPPSDGGGIGIWGPVTGESHFEASPTVGYYRFTVTAGGEYYVVSALGVAYRPSVSGSGLYWDYFHSANTFTLNARIRDYFYLDAEIRNIKTGSFTARALLQVRRSGTFTARATKQRTQSRTFTLNAVLVPKRFTVGAFVQPYFRLDARIVHLIFGSFTLRAWKAGRFRLNAVKKASRTGSFTVRAQIIVKRQGSFTLDYFIQPAFYIAATSRIHHVFQAPTRGIRLNAQIVRNVSGSFTVRASKAGATRLFAVVKKTQTPSFFLDAEHRHIVSGFFTVAARVHPFFVARAVIKRSQSHSFTVAAQVVIRRTGSFSIAASIRFAFYVRAVIKRTVTPNLFNISARKGPRTVARTIRVAAEIKSPGAFWDPIDEMWCFPEFHIDAVKGLRRSRSFRLAARIFKAGNDTTTIDALVKATIHGAFRLEALKAVSVTVLTPEAEFLLDAWIVGTRASFQLDAEIIEFTKLHAFTIGAESVPVGVHNGGIDLSAHVLGRSTLLFNVIAYVAERHFLLDAVIDGNDMTLDAFVQPYFFVNALIKATVGPVGTDRTFKADAYKSAHSRTGSCRADAFIGVTGQKYGYAFTDAVVLGSRSTTDAPFLPAVYVSAYIDRPPAALTLNAFVSPYFGVDAYVQPYFTLNAYVQGTNIVVWPEDGGPPTMGPGGPPITGGGQVSRKFRLKIELGVVDAESIVPSSGVFWEERVGKIAGYVNTYEALDSLSSDQQAALTTDRATLAADMKRFHQSITPTVEWVDVTGDVIWNSASFTQAARAGVGTFSLSLDGIAQFRGGEEIRVYVDDRRVFGGYVTTVDYQYNFSAYANPRTVLTGVDYNILFDRLFVYNVLWEFENHRLTGNHAGKYVPWKSFPAGTPDSVIINTVMRDYVGPNAPIDLDYTTGVKHISTPATETSWMMPSPGSPMRTVFQSISMITSGVWYIDAEKVLRYHDRSTVTAPQPITDGYGGVSTRDLVISSDMSNMKNDVLVWGLLQHKDNDATINYSHQLGDGHAMERYYQAAVEQMQGYINTYTAIPASERTAEQNADLATDRRTLATDKAELAYWRAHPEVNSIAVYGRSQFGEPRQDLFGKKHVDKRALSILRRYQLPIMQAEATVFEPYFGAGQIARLKSATYGIDTPLAINQMTMTFAVPKEPEGLTYFALPQYRLSLGLNPEDPWNFYDYLPYPGENTAGQQAQDSGNSGGTSGGSGSPSGGGNPMGTGQRRFWNAMKPKNDGIIWIGSWGGMQDGTGGTKELLASVDGCTWEHVYWGEELSQNKAFFEEWGTVKPFPLKFRLHRYWRLHFDITVLAGQYWDGFHINEWIFKPWETNMGVSGGDVWLRGNPETNLFWTSSRHWKEDADGDYDPNGTLNTRVRYEAHLQQRDPHSGKKIDLLPWTNFGGGQGLYGYLNDVYFGYNQFGGNKPNVGINPKMNAVGDLSKVYPGFMGMFGLHPGIPGIDVRFTADWTFDLCDEPELQSAQGLVRDDYLQSEGWGGEWVVCDDDGIFETKVTPTRGTLTVYNVEGYMLHDPYHYTRLKGDKTGRKFQLVKNADGSRGPTSPKHDCADSDIWYGASAHEGFGGHVDGTNGSSPYGESPSRCDAGGHVIHSRALAVTYLVTAQTVVNPRRTAKLPSGAVTADRLERTDVRGF